MNVDSACDLGSFIVGIEFFLFTLVHLHRRSAYTIFHFIQSGLVNHLKEYANETFRR